MSLKILSLVFFVLIIICNACDNSKNSTSDNPNNITADTLVILALEQKLIEAYKSNDLKTVADLYHDNLIFNTPDGRTITGADDIESLRSGILKIEVYAPISYSIDITDDIATVNAYVHIKGKAANNAFEGDFDFLRVWKRVGKDWKLMTISGSQSKEHDRVVKKSNDTAFTINGLKFHLHDFSKSYSSIDAKPFTEALFTTKTSISKDDKIIYQDTIAYHFYLKINYWPRVIHYPNDKVLVLLEEWKYEPYGGQFIGLIFDNYRFEKRFEIFSLSSSEYYQDSILFKYFKEDVGY